MINIIMENAESRVLGLDSKALERLRNDVCFFDQSMWIRTRNVYACRKHLICKNGFFPTGLLKRVTDHLVKQGFMYEVIDNRVVPENVFLDLVDMLDEPPIYPEQEAAANALYRNVSGTVSLPTGVGKTRTIKQALLLHRRPSLIITPSSNLREQMYGYLKASFGDKFVGKIGDGRKKPIMVANYHAIKSESRKFYSAYHCKYYDEYHNASNNTIRDDAKEFLSDIYHTYGLTATNFKNDESEQILLECVLSNELYSMTTLEAINKGYIVPVTPIFKNLDNKNLVSVGDYRKDFKRFMDDNQEKNEYTIENARKMTQHNIPTIILVEHIQHGKLIKDSLPGFVFLNGQDADSAWNMRQIQLFNEGKIPGIVGTSVIGEGVDTKACGAMFNLAGGKARSELMQRVGRTVRKFPGKKCGYYFDFFDNGQKNLLSHSKKRQQIIEETYGTKIRMV